MPFYRKLSEISLDEVTEYGGKAARLGEAAQLQCPVLSGVVLSTGLYRRFMQQGGLQGEVSTILATMQPTALAHFQAAEWAIESAFRVRRVPDEIEEAIRQAWRFLGKVSVAVRSSATNEDSPRQSFVGQHATYLDVDSEEDLFDAVVGCWRSLFSAKALSYAQRFDVDLLSSSMAVLLQPMIRPVSQGVLLTVDPISGDADVFVLEVQRGPQEGVYRLDPYESQTEQVQFEGNLRKLGLLLDEHWEAYQAIEWAIDEKGRLRILRVRPVTDNPLYLPLRSEDVGAGREPLQLVPSSHDDSRSLSPFSWYHRSRTSRLNAAYFRDVNPLFCPYCGRDTFYLCGYLYEQRHAFPDTSPEEEGRMGILVHALRCLYAARGLGDECRVLDQEQRARLDALTQRDLATLSSEELAAQLREVMTLHECFWAERGKLGDVDDVLFEILCRLHELWLDESLDCRDLAWTGGGRRTQAWEDLSDLARADYADDVERQAAFETFYLAHRHLFVRDAPLTERWDILGIREDKDAAWGRFSSRAEEEGPPLREQNAQREEDRQRTVRAILSRLRGLREAIYSSLLEMVRGYRVLVANCHDAVLLCRLLERDVVREVGRRLYVRGATTSVEHARLLGSLEIVNWLESRIATDELVQTISERKEVYRRWQRYAPPPEMELEDRSTDGGVPENALQGQAVSPGVAGGSARIVDTVGEATEVRPGDVLVCHEPLFELSPLFSIVSAVVAEGGGLLDHAGVLVREYRIPAVFGVRGATDSLHEGEPVEVDGRRGLVIPRLPERSDLAADMDALER